VARQRRPQLGQKAATTPGESVLLRLSVRSGFAYAARLRGGKDAPSRHLKSLFEGSLFKVVDVEGFWRACERLNALWQIRRSHLVRARSSRRPSATLHRYNKCFMVGLLYAAVTYVRSPAGVFVEEMRRDLHPTHTHADAHITILPPRTLSGTEEKAIQQLESVCRTIAPFEVTMGDVESFVPVTPTVFIRVTHGAYRFRELHDRLNTGALHCDEPWPYMPHLTIVKMDTVDEARKVVGLARPRWDGCDDSRKVRIDTVTFVKGVGERWMDLATIPLGLGSKK